MACLSLKAGCIRCRFWRMRARPVLTGAGVNGSNWRATVKPFSAGGNVAGTGSRANASSAPAGRPRSCSSRSCAERSCADAAAVRGAPVRLVLSSEVLSSTAGGSVLIRVSRKSSHDSCGKPSAPAGQCCRCVRCRSRAFKRCRLPTFNSFSGLFRRLSCSSAGNSLNPLCRLEPSVKRLSARSRCIRRERRCDSIGHSCKALLLRSRVRTSLNALMNPRICAPATRWPLSSSVRTCAKASAGNTGSSLSLKPDKSTVEALIVAP